MWGLTAGQHVYLVHAEEGLVLGHHGVAGLGENANQRLLIQAVQGNHHRQAAHKLRDHPKLDEVPGLHEPQQPILLLHLSHGVHLPACGVGQVCRCRRPPALPQVRRCSKSQVLFRNTGMLLMHMNLSTLIIG